VPTILIRTLCAALVVVLCSACGVPGSRTVSSSVTVPPTATSEPPTATPTVTASFTPTATPTITPSPTATPTNTVTPGPTPDGTVRSIRVPILMYHYVSQPPPNADVYRNDLSVTPAQFESHVQALQDAGYQSIPLADLVSYLATGQPELPGKSVVLTFDDGYVDNYENALPVLQKYSFTATIFVITDFVDMQRPGYATWAQLAEMYAAGLDIGSHSRDHADLSGRDVDFLVWQALGSRQMIESRLGFTPQLFCYPAGRYDDLAIQVIRSADYWGAVTTQQGATHASDAPFELTRVRVRGSHTASDLLRLLDTDW
jgi:peptidoglycan/xylan/chitin deacetylase (PgdA/CDA1 family)